MEVVMGMLSKRKGKRAESQWRDFLIGNDIPARRGQQFSGDPSAPDVICDTLKTFRFEVKHQEHLNLRDAMAQVEREREPWQVGVVAHRTNRHPWLVTMTAEAWLALALLAKSAEAMAKERPT